MPLSNPLQCGMRRPASLPPLLAAALALAASVNLLLLGREVPRQAPERAAPQVVPTAPTPPTTVLVHWSPPAACLGAAALDTLDALLAALQPQAPPRNPNAGNNATTSQTNSGLRLRLLVPAPAYGEFYPFSDTIAFTFAEGLRKRRTAAVENAAPVLVNGASLARRVGNGSGARWLHHWAPAFWPESMAYSRFRSIPVSVVLPTASRCARDTFASSRPGLLHMSSLLPVELFSFAMLVLAREESNQGRHVLALDLSAPPATPAELAATVRGRQLAWEFSSPRPLLATAVAIQDEAALDARARSTRKHAAKSWWTWPGFLRGNSPKSAEGTTAQHDHFGTLPHPLALQGPCRDHEFTHTHRRVVAAAPAAWQLLPRPPWTRCAGGAPLEPFRNPPAGAGVRRTGGWTTRAACGAGRGPCRCQRMPRRSSTARSRPSTRIPRTSAGAHVWERSCSSARRRRVQCANRPTPPTPRPRTMRLCGAQMQQCGQPAPGLPFLSRPLRCITAPCSAIVARPQSFSL